MDMINIKPKLERRDKLLIGMKTKSSIVSLPSPSRSLENDFAPSISSKHSFSPTPSPSFPLLVFSDMNKWNDKSFN